MSPLEIAAVLISFAGIWLTTKRHLLCWPTNLLACALYAKLFLDVRLYADMTLQVLFGAAIIYGWIAWLAGRTAQGDIPTRTLPRNEAALSLAAGALAAAAIAWAFRRYTNAAQPELDATLSSFSLVAQLWTARRYPESWLLWIGVDTIYVGLFLYKSLYLTAALYAALTSLAVLGWLRWHRAAA